MQWSMDQNCTVQNTCQRGLFILRHKHHSCPLWDQIDFREVPCIQQCQCHKVYATYSISLGFFPDFLPNALFVQVMGKPFPAMSWVIHAIKAGVICANMADCYIECKRIMHWILHVRPNCSHLIQILITTMLMHNLLMQSTTNSLLVTKVQQVIVHNLSWEKPSQYKLKYSVLSFLFFVRLSILIRLNTKSWVSADVYTLIGWSCREHLDTDKKSFLNTNSQKYSSPQQ